MPDARQQHDARRRRKRRAPLEHGARRHDVVGVAVNEQPRASRRDEIRRQPVDRRRDGDEPGGRRTRGDRGRDGGAEREPAEIQPPVGPARAAPRDDGERIVALADAVRIAAGRRADAAKVEPHRVRPEARERARERRHDLVAHRALLQRMRMANRRPSRPPARARVDRRFEHAGRTRDLDGRRLAFALRPLTSRALRAEIGESSLRRATNAAGSSSCRPSASTACSNSSRPSARTARDPIRDRVAARARAPGSARGSESPPALDGPPRRAARAFGSPGRAR